MSPGYQDLMGHLILTVDLWSVLTWITLVHTVKSQLKISQNFVAFSEYMNFNNVFIFIHFKILNIKDCFFQALKIGTFRPASTASGTCGYLGAEITKTPSALKFEASSSCLQSLGKVYRLQNCLETKLLPSSEFSVCLASTVKLFCITFTLSSSGLYREVSIVISNALSSSFT